MKKTYFFAASLILLTIFPTLTLSGQEAADSPSSGEITHSLVLQISTLPEAKLGYTFNYKVPFLQGAGPLTEGNNINVALTAEVSPISLLGQAVFTWTPAAFLEFSMGSKFGTGWTIELFGSKIYGLGVTKSAVNNEVEVVKDSGGLYGKVHAGGALQFDLAAVVPGDWNHAVFRTYHEINCAGNTEASGVISWIFENDDGENLNGLKYYGNALIGYQMPIFLNMIALLAEAEISLFGFADKHIWGEDLPNWTFSGILNFAVHKQVDITLLAQFITRRNYIESDWEKKYYRSLTINTADPLRLEFYRIAAVATYKF